MRCFAIKKRRRRRKCDSVTSFFLEKTSIFDRRRWFSTLIIFFSILFFFFSEKVKILRSLRKRRRRRRRRKKAEETERKVSQKPILCRARLLAYSLSTPAPLALDHNHQTTLPTCIKQGLINLVKEEEEKNAFGKCSIFRFLRFFPSFPLVVECSYLTQLSSAPFSPRNQAGARKKGKFDCPFLFHVCCSISLLELHTRKRRKSRRRSLVSSVSSSFFPSKLFLSLSLSLSSHLCLLTMFTSSLEQQVAIVLAEISSSPFDLVS